MESLTSALLNDLLSRDEWSVHTAADNGAANNNGRVQGPNRKLQFSHDKEEEEQQANDEDGLQVRSVG